MQAATESRRPTIRGRMRLMVAIPMVVLLLVWLTVSGFLFSRAAVQIIAGNAAEDLLIPSAIALSAVMDERSATAGYLERPDAYGEDLAESRALVDEYMGEVIAGFEDLSRFLDQRVQERLDELAERVTDLDDLREQVDSGNADREAVLSGYTAVTQAGADLYEEQARAGTNPPSMVVGLSATHLFRAVDEFSAADAQLSEAFASGELTPADQSRFTELIGGFHTQLGTVSQYLGPEQTEQWRELEQSAQWQALRELEREIVEREVATEIDPSTGELQTDTGLPIDAEDWDSAFADVKSELVNIGADQAGLAADTTRDTANKFLLIAIAASLGILAVFVVALAVARRTGSGIAWRLLRLRDATQELAEQRLPDIMRRLGAGERVDVDEELPDLRHTPDEIGDVARSFAAAQRAAVGAAVSQAEIRHGVNRLFVSVAHRSQALAHRQLRLLDKLERDEEDPRQIADLFKLDHLATRARRYSENLLLLGGETVGARSAHPLPLVDVIRAAVSACGDYTRIARQRIAPAALRGAAAADVIHLLAELLDNAVNFSPPQTQVHITAENVPKGIVVEIEDRGIGMGHEEFAKANELLATAPEFDVLRLDEEFQLGLFAVSRLAHRHGIRVNLRPSPYGGVQAIVLIPAELTEEPPAGETPKETPAAEAGPQTPIDPIDPIDPADAAERATSPRHAARTRTPAPEEAEPPTPTAPDPAPDPAAATAEAAPPERPPLPRRTPQANLAPQLALDPVTGSGATPHAGASRLPAPPDARPDAGEADDEERLRHVSSMLSAFQRGTERGRAAQRAQHQDAPATED